MQKRDKHHTNTTHKKREKKETNHQTEVSKERFTEQSF